ncbi:MAG: DUF1801 domain-containing protein [Caulobacteraceae bacterium]
MERLFLIDGPDDPVAINFYVAGCAPALVPIAAKLVALVRDSAPGGEELMHDGHATFCLERSPFVYVAAFTSHVNLGFFNGAGLDDPGALLQGQGKRMRHVKVRPEGAFDEAALRRLVARSYAAKRLELGGNGSAP